MTSQLLGRPLCIALHRFNELYEYLIEYRLGIQFIEASKLMATFELIRSKFHSCITLHSVVVVV